MADTWSPSAYLQFKDERTRPARDLVAQIPLGEAPRIVDVGCGPGNSTALLLARYPSATILGIDSSPTMLAEARTALTTVHFEEGDVNTWLPDRTIDLVFGNAVYQWVANHLELFPRILDSMRPGAVLAVQMPDNLAEPTHQIMKEVAADARWAASGHFSTR